MPRYSIGRSQIVESTGHVTPAERIEWARERYRLARKAAFAAHFRDAALNAAAEGRKRELEELERALTAVHARPTPRGSHEDHQHDRRPL